MVNADDVFSVVALFILFRETIEASIIVGVLMQFLSRSKPALIRTVWWAVLAGVGGSIIFGVIFVVLYYVAQNNLFQGRNRDIFKGVISWVAALLIAILAFAMLRFLGWEAKWKRRLEASAAKVTAAKKEAEAAALAAASTEQQERLTLSSHQENSASQLVLGQLAEADSSQLPLSQPAREHSITKPAQLEGQNSAAVLAPLSRQASSSSKSAQPAAALDAPDRSNSNNTAVEQLLKDVESGEPVITGPDMTPATRQEWWSIWLLVFTTVIREGIESVVFLGGVGNSKPSGIPLAGVVGITAGVLVGMFLFYSGKQVKDMKWLIIGMSVVIFFIAAGQVGNGTDALIRVGMFGYCSPWLDERPWTMVPLWDISGCCSDQDNKNKFFALMRAIFGYQDKPTFIEVMFYCGFWLLVIIIGLAKWKHGSLFDADFKYNQEQRKLAKERAEAARLAEEQALAEVKLGSGELTEYDSSSIDSKVKDSDVAIELADDKHKGPQQDSKEAFSQEHIELAKQPGV